jgi:hypothetical protein
LDERQQCVFSLIRYVPDPVKDEFVNIGVILSEVKVPEHIELRLTRDWSRVRCMDPMADISMLEAFENDMRANAKSLPDQLRLLSDSLSNFLRLTDPKGCLAETFQTQMDSLFKMYVEVRKPVREKRAAGRVTIHAQMRRTFERAQVWQEMMKRIPASQYTRTGDPLYIDCGYRPNGVIKMFHAVSLDDDVEGAKSLALSAPDIAEGVQRVAGARLELTAIIQPLRAIRDEVDRVERYHFAVETMERQKIRVLTVNDLDRLASTARTELRIE